MTDLGHCLTMDVTESIPKTGAVFTFGSSKLTGSTTSCFWLKNDVIVSASCGDEHVALVTEKGKVYVFGSNNWGQLGLDNTHASKKPVCVKLLRGHKATMVACGRNHTLVCTSDDQVFAFGNNSDFQIGVSSISNSNVPIKIKTETCGRVKQIAAGADFSILLNTNGEVYAWGSNAEGQLGLGNDVNEAEEPIMIHGLEQIQHVACGYYHTALASISGKLYTFGENEFGKLGERITFDTSVPSPVKLAQSVKVVKVACGGSHSAFLTQTGEVYTFGGGNHGELGHGANSLQIMQPAVIVRMKNHEIAHISCGENFTSVVTTKGRLYTFGDGRHGKLAGDEENFTNQFLPFRCKRFEKYTVGFAVCGGCHMVVSATGRQGDVEDTDSENEDPMQAIVDETFLTKSAVHITQESNDNTNIASAALKTVPDLSRSLSAREKRRQDREKPLSQTLPPLRSLKTDQLIMAAKSLPRPSVLHQSISNEWPSLPKKAAAKGLDEVSEMSAFNKVHKLVKVGKLDAFVPVSQPGDVNGSVGDEPEEISEDHDAGEVESMQNNDMFQDIPQNSSRMETELKTDKETAKTKSSDVNYIEAEDKKIVSEVTKNGDEGTDEDGEYSDDEEEEKDRAVVPEKEDPAGKNEIPVNLESMHNSAYSDNKNQQTDADPKKTEHVSKVEEQIRPQDGAVKTKGTKKSKLCIIL